MKFLLLGNPENRRVRLFTDALDGPCDVVSWREYLSEPRVLERFPDEPRFVRIDSYGEDFEVERLLLRRGGFEGEIVERRGEVLAPRIAHAGFTDALRSLSALFAARPSWRILNVPEEIDELFDKRRTARRFREAGVPIPEFLEQVPDQPEELITVCRARGWRQIFVKPSMGSSASGVLLVTIGPRQVSIRTSLEWDAPRWFNNLRLSTHDTPESTERALRFVLSQGAQVERAIPKARIGDDFFDLRVLCIAHEPRFIVMRQSHHAITNLHLGGWRGDLDALKQRVQPAAWEAMLESCRTVAKRYRSLHVGLDVMFEPNLVDHRVIEANAFGDLLPNLFVEGKSVAEYELTSLGVPSRPSRPP